MLENVLGFIGLGVMGSSMAGHLLDAGYELHVYTRTMSKAAPLLERGAIAEESVADLASKCDVIFTIVGFPQDVEEVYLGGGGIIEHAKSGALLVDMTTSSPSLARVIYERAHEKGMAALDAPVTGGDKGAREASLTVLVGGDREDMERAMPYLEKMGKKIRYMGGAGAGQTAKLANQIAICGTMTGMCEAMIFAEANGLDAQNVIETIAGGAAGSWSLSNYSPRIFGGDFAPGFFVKHYIKDLKLASEAAADSCGDLPSLELTLGMYEELAADGHAEDGTQALYKLYKKRAK